MQIPRTEKKRGRPTGCPLFLGRKQALTLRPELVAAYLTRFAFLLRIWLPTRLMAAMARSQTITFTSPVLGTSSYSSEEDDADPGFDVFGAGVAVGATVGVGVAGAAES